MTKVIKLTERDLMNIVKRVINEQSLSLEAKLLTKGFEKFKNNILVKKIPGVGDFYFNLKNNGAEITILNPSDKVISKFNSKSSNKIKLGFKPDVEAERLSDYIIKSFGTTPPPPLPMDEERFDFEKMSDDELHSLHPQVRKHERHFKDFTPTSEYLGWRGEVDKRNIYKRHGKFHNAFTDKNIED
jgi:hypothetical protein